MEGNLEALLWWMVFRKLSAQRDGKECSVLWQKQQSAETRRLTQFLEAP